MKKYNQSSGDILIKFSDDFNQRYEVKKNHNGLALMIFIGLISLLIILLTNAESIRSFILMING